jgi:hypothetical protein
VRKLCANTQLAQAISSWIPSFFIWYKNALYSIRQPSPFHGFLQQLSFHFSGGHNILFAKIAQILIPGISIHAPRVGDPNRSLAFPPRRLPFGGAARPRQGRAQCAIGNP